jgi:hypothetical protein
LYQLQLYQSRTPVVFINVLGHGGRKVTDSTTNEPLTGATVELEKAGKKTYSIVNLDGSFVFRNVAEASYTPEVKIYRLSKHR